MATVELAHTLVDDPGKEGGGDRWGDPPWVGPWALIDRIGVGGMGVVHRAVHIDTGELVALKLAEPGPVEVAALRREARALARCEHPGIVRLRGRGLAAGRPYLAMSLVDGPTLAARVEQWRAAGELGRRELGEALGLLAGVCEALAHLHDRGLVHRDLKPANVLVETLAGGRERPVLADLGLAEFAPVAGSPGPVDSPRAGSEAYMAPEQRFGEPVDARADLYALGRMIHEIVLGVPGPAEGPGTKLALAASAARLRLLGLGELGELLPALLASRPEQRPRHAREPLRALSHVVDDLLGARAWSPARRRAQLGPYLRAPGTVGRERERERFAVLVEELCERRRGRGMAIVGPSNSGKSHLLADFAAQLRRRDSKGEASAAAVAGLRVIAIEGSVSPRDGVDEGELAGVASPFESLRPWLRGLARELTVADPEQRRRLVGRRRERAAVLARVEPALARFAGRRQPRPVPAEGERQRLLAHARELLCSLAAEGPTLILVDDVERVDELTRCLLASFDDRALERAPLALVVTAASVDSVPELPGLGAGSLSLLEPLDAEAQARLVTGALASRRPPEAILDRLRRESSPAQRGLPGFVLAWLHAQVDAGALVDREGVADLARGPRGAPAILREPRSRSLAGMIDATLDALSPVTFELLGALALLGLRAPLERLLRVRPCSEQALSRALNQAIGSRVLVEDLRGVVGFSHPLARTRLLARLEPTLRRRLHHDIAAAAEADASLAAWLGPARVADHLELAGLRRRAARAQREAGERALAIGASELATRCFRRSLALYEAGLARADEPLSFDSERIVSILREAPRTSAAPEPAPEAPRPEDSQTLADADAVVVGVARRERAGGHAAAGPVLVALDGVDEADEAGEAVEPTEMATAPGSDDEDEDEAELADLPRFLRRRPSGGWAEFELTADERAAQRDRFSEVEAIDPLRERAEPGSGPHPGSLALDPIPDARARPPSTGNHRAHLQRRLIESLELEGDRDGALAQISRALALRSSTRALVDPGLELGGLRRAVAGLRALPATIALLLELRRGPGPVLDDAAARESLLVDAALQRELGDQLLDRGASSFAAALAAREALVAARKAGGISLEWVAAVETAARVGDRLGLRTWVARLVAERVAEAPATKLGERAHLEHLAARRAFAAARWDECRTRARLAGEIFARLELRPREHACRLLAAFAALTQGRWALAERELEGLRAVALASHNHTLETWCRIGELLVAIEAGEGARAEACSEELEQTLAIVHDPALRCLGAGCLARWRSISGHPIRALEHAREALAAAERGRLDAVQVIWGLAPAAELLCGRAEARARARARRLLKIWARPLTVAAPALRRCAARCALGRRRPDLAAHHLRVAADRSIELDMLPELARTRRMSREFRS